MIQRQSLTAATVFSSIAIFLQFREALWLTFHFVPEILNGLFFTQCFRKQQILEFILL